MALGIIFETIEGNFKEILSRNGYFYIEIDLMISATEVLGGSGGMLPEKILK